MFFFLLEQQIVHRSKPKHLQLPGRSRRSLYAFLDILFMRLFVNFLPGFIFVASPVIKGPADVIPHSFPQLISVGNAARLHHRCNGLVDDRLSSTRESMDSYRVPDGSLKSKQILLVKIITSLL